MTLRTLLAPLAVPVLALSLAMPSPAPAEDVRESDRGDAVRARNIALGLAAVAAVALAARAAERADDEEERVLPSACLRRFHPRGEDGRPVVLHEPGCLDDRVERAGDLPLACAVTLRTRAGFETGFDPGCLAEEGWRTD